MTLKKRVAESLIVVIQRRQQFRWERATQRIHVPYRPTSGSQPVVRGPSVISGPSVVSGPLIGGPRTRPPKKVEEKICVWNEIA